MFRRNFIQRFTLAGAAGLSAASARPDRTVIFSVKGFTCVTCAVGLDTILGQQTGVVHCKSSYPDGLTTIEFKAGLVSEEALQAAIAEMGFTATALRGKQ